MKSDRKSTYQKIVAYFDKKLSAKGQHQFEKLMMQDDFESEAYDGLSKLKGKELREDLTELRLNLENRVKRTRGIAIWIPYAAIVVILIGLGSVLYFISNESYREELVSQKIENEEVATTQDTASRFEDIKEYFGKDSIVIEKAVLEIADTGQDVVNDSQVKTVERKETEEIRDVSKTVTNPVIAKVDADALNRDTNQTFTGKEALVGKVPGVTANKKSSVRIKEFASSGNEPKAMRRIGGIVVSEDKEPLPGVNIIQKNTGEKTVTDMDGYFKMSLADTSSDNKLAVSFIGYETKEIDPSDSLLVILEQDASGLEEVVVTNNDIKNESNDSWKKAKPTISKNLNEYKQKLVAAVNRHNYPHLKGKYKLKVSFRVEAHGGIESIQIKGDIDSNLVSEVKELIMNGESWNAAKLKGTPVSSTIRFNLKFEFD